MVSMEEEQQQYRIPPKLLFRSFLIVGGSYIVFSIVYGTMLILLANWFFPETHDFLFVQNTDKPLEELLASAPTLGLPINLFWAWLASTALICVPIGWLASKLPPFAKTHHALFVAIIVFVDRIQAAVKCSGDNQWMFLVMILVFPIAILIGAKMHGGQKIPQGEA